MDSLLSHIPTHTHIHTHTQMRTHTHTTPRRVVLPQDTVQLEATLENRSWISFQEVLQQASLMPDESTVKQNQRWAGCSWKKRIPSEHPWLSKTLIRHATMSVIFLSLGNKKQRCACYSAEFISRFVFIPPARSDLVVQLTCQEMGYCTQSAPRGALKNCTPPISCSQMQI